MATKIKIGASRKPVAASEFKFADGSKAVGANGELNASDKRDLMNRQVQFLTAASNGLVAADATIASREQLAVRAKQNREELVAMFNDASGQKQKVLGERIADALYVTANRSGFMRKYLAKQTVEQGSIPRFPVRQKNVIAVMSTSPTKIKTQIMQDNWYTPPELQIIARPYVTQNELNQSAGDVLAEKYNEAVEALMVAEDRMWYNQVQHLSNVENEQMVIPGQLTPFTVAQVAQKVMRWGLKPAHILMATDLYQDIIGNSEFYTAVDPVARHELLLTGQLGVLYGMTITSDAYRFPEHKVLGQGEFYVISDEINHGAYSDRGGIMSTPTDITTERTPGRGWVLQETIALCVANARSVAKGIRI